MKSHSNIELLATSQKLRYYIYFLIFLIFPTTQSYGTDVDGDGIADEITNITPDYEYLGGWDYEYNYLISNTLSTRKYMIQSSTNTTTWWDETSWTWGNGGLLDCTWIDVWLLYHRCAKRGPPTSSISGVPAIECVNDPFQAQAVLEGGGSLPSGYSIDWSGDVDVISQNGLTANLSWKTIGTNKQVYAGTKWGISVQTAKAAASGAAIKSEYTITLKTFIPEQWVDHPTNSSKISGGNDRSFSYSSNEYKTKQKYVVVICATDSQAVIKQNSYSGNGSESRNYDRDTSLDGSNRLTSAALSDTVTGPPKMTESGTQSDIGDGNGATGNKIANYKVSGSTVVNADNPIILFSPNIQNDFVVAVDATTPSNIKYKVTGQHRPYPSHEIYIDSTRVWEYNKGNNEPIDLFLPKIAVDTGYQSL